MAVIAGIDEAGYGPRLGPLVMSAASFEADHLDGTVDLWDILSEAVARKAARSGKRLLVTDSKKAYSRALGLKRLEETTLAFLAVAGCRVESLNDLMSVVCPGHGAVRPAYPWYAESDVEIPVDATREDLERNVELLSQCLDEAGIRFCGIESRALCVGEFNASVKRTRNKAAMLFEQSAHLLHSLWDRNAAQGATVFIDKQGGRNKYVPYLAPEFMGKMIETREEGLERSVYEIRQGDARMEVHFVMEGDDHHFPTALASMCSKYLRELHLQLFNRYWKREIPSLRETAGYASDAKRFLKDIEPACRRIGIDYGIMVRMK